MTPYRRDSLLIALVAIAFLLLVAVSGVLAATDTPHREPTAVFVTPEPMPAAPG